MPFLIINYSSNLSIKGNNPAIRMIKGVISIVWLDNNRIGPMINVVLGDNIYSWRGRIIININIEAIIPIQNKI